MNSFESDAEPGSENIYLQISDLHLGLIDPQNGNLSAAIPPWSNYLETFKGQFGHHYLALQRLAEFHTTLSERKYRTRLLMTGDATSYGHIQQFENANDYLADELHGCGLKVLDWLDYAVSGNHDYWPGSRRILGRPTAGLSKYFPPAPRFSGLIPLAATHFVRFLCVNTDADVFSYGPSRFLARGAFHSQLQTLDNALPPPRTNEIRVLLLHHSPLYAPPNGGKALTMRSRSRRALDSFVVNHGVSVLMCGHTHAAKIDTYIATASNGQSNTVVECCCGTTTQRDRFPPGFATPTGGFPTWKLDPNTLILHRFEITDGEVFLVSQPYVLASTGFKPYLQEDRHRVH